MHHIVEMFGFTLPICFLTALSLKLTNGRKDVPLYIPFRKFLGDLSLFYSFNLSFFPFKNNLDELKKKTGYKEKINVQLNPGVRIKKHRFYRRKTLF